MYILLNSSVEYLTEQWNCYINLIINNVLLIKNVRGKGVWFI